MTKLKAAVIGTGFIGPAHVEGLLRAGVNVVGILGSSLEKSQRSAQALGLARAYATFDELLADDTVQSVHVTTPNRFHFDMASRALRAGKHVMCEKPLAMTSVESAELVRIADGSGRAAAVTYNLRFYPLCHEARERVRSGELGEVLHVNGAFVQDWLLYDTDFNWRVLAAEGGEVRAIGDIGTHWLDLVQFIIGARVVEVFADLRTIHTTRKRPASGSVETFTDKQAKQVEESEAVPITTEDCGSVLLRFDNGARGCLWVSQMTAGRKCSLRFEIGGSRAALAHDSERPNELWIGHRNQPNQLLLKDPALLSPAARAITGYPGGHNEGYPDCFKQLFRSFYGYISAGERRRAGSPTYISADELNAPPPFPTFSDGHNEILLCEAILQSHREERWVEVVT